MRARTAVPAVVLSVVALVAAWEAGSRPHEPSALPGVVVASPAPTATQPRTARPPSRSGRASRQTAGRPSAPAVRRVPGSVVSTPYGDVQVVAVLHGSRLADVLAARLTDANQHSRDISSGAAPVLRGEALAAQSAHIDMVSGATYTSEGYIESLQAALDEAGL